ncbi:MAG TPA: protoporphyrinogen oxidase, partial [Longimicrobiales bacterium]|nr:protoporphyrinogen oxidase [Longimicrobiales bacterium]
MIAIIGGGISGLALAHRLAAQGRDFVLLEASSRVGGVMRSGRVDGHLLEWGPQRGRLTTDFAALVDDLGLRDRLITSPPDLPLFVYRNGALRTVPFSPGAFLRSDILSLRGKLRLLAEPFTGAARDDESVADYFTRKIGREAYENLVGPLYGGLYASDPADMVLGLSLRHVLREFAIERSMLLPLLKRGGTIAPPDACSFDDGMETLPRALYERHRARIRLNSPIVSLARDGAGYAVRTAAGSFTAEHVVISVPAPAASRVLRDVAPEAARRIGMLHYNPLAVVHLHADTGLRGLGYQVSFAEPLITRGVTFNDSLFQRQGVYTVYLGGAKNAWVAQEERDKLSEIAVREFRQATGSDARVLSVEHERMPAWDRSWSAIQGLELPPGLHIHANW